MKMKVDFFYAFATPHRLTVCLPNSSDKTLLDCSETGLRLAWSYDDLRGKPLAAFVTPKVDWEVNLKPSLDGQPFASQHWTRSGGWLPVLEQTYEDGQVSLRLEVVGGQTAALVRVTRGPVAAVATANGAAMTTDRASVATCDAWRALWTATGIREVMRRTCEETTRSRK
jgi:hypothetical protein